MLRDMLKDITSHGCHKSGMESYLVLDALIPFVKGMTQFLETHSLFGLATLKPDPGVGLTINTSQYDLLKTRSEKKFHKALDLSESKVEFSVKDDMKDPQTYCVRDVFLYKKPRWNRTCFTLNYRKVASIILSNVGAASLVQDGFIPVLFLQTEPAETS